jgi:hypothetical protein
MDGHLFSKSLSRDGPVLWPARSVWGNLKQLVYASPVNTIEELQIRVQNVTQEIRQSRIILNRVRFSWARRTTRTETCVANDDKHLSNFFDVSFHVFTHNY